MKLSSRLLDFTWVTAAKPSTASSTAATTCPREVGCRRAARSRPRPSGGGWDPPAGDGSTAPGSAGASTPSDSSTGSARSERCVSSVRSVLWTWLVWPVRPIRFVMAGSRMEEVPADGRDVGEDPDAEDHDDARGQLAAHAELVTEVDDQRGDQDVGDEGDDEHLVVEDAVQEGAESPEDGIEGGHDRDRQVGVEPYRDSRLQQQPHEHAEQQADGRDHRRGPRARAPPPLRRPGGGGPPGLLFFRAGLQPRGGC